MITVLLVEDDNIKAGEIASVLESNGILGNAISLARTATEAVDLLSGRVFDLVLLDMNLPRRIGEPSQRGVGLDILKMLENPANGLRVPKYVVAVTSYSDIYEEFGSRFVGTIWNIVMYGSDGQWKGKLKAIIANLESICSYSNQIDGRNYGIDFAVICALPDVEMRAVLDLPLGWKEQDFHNDNTRYFFGVLESNSSNKTVVAASASRMGIAATAVLATKIISNFRPRYLIMSGICGGRKDRVAIGDIVLASPCWDWGSGKFVQSEDPEQGGDVFQPSPHQFDVDPKILKIASLMREDYALLARIRNSCHGKKPATELRAHIGPMATGAAVIASKSKFAEIEEDMRAIIAIDMEAYAVFNACRDSGSPQTFPIVIKSVSDVADDKKNDDFQQYASETSAKFAHELMKQIS